MTKAILVLLMTLACGIAYGDCNGKRVDIDIIQPTPVLDENKIVVYVNDKVHSTLMVKGDLSDKKVMANIKGWFNQVVKEVCR